MGNENIGGISVALAVNLSDLQAQLQQAQQMAEQAGKAMAAAFNTSAGGLTQVASAAGDASVKVESLSGAFQSLISIGSTLAIAEGIKSFAQEALTAQGDIEKTTISIEHMTRSSEQTAQILAQIKEVGLSSPFSFPELQDTTQKMIAMGVPVDKIGESLRGIVDAAAATGKSLIVTGGAFDRITETGSAAARQLAQVGVTTERLAVVLGVTKDKVLEAFKDLPDQAARIDALNQAMERFSGSAEAQADGIRGAWQILENRFELVMQGIGKALEPAIKDIISFGTVAIEYAQKAIDAFNEIPDPLKEIIGLVGTLGVSFVTIQSTIGPLTNLLLALGLRTGEVAVANTAAAASMEVLAAAETETTVATEIGIAQSNLFQEEIAATAAEATAAGTQLSLLGPEIGAVALSSGTAATAATEAGVGLTAMGVASLALGAAIAGLIGFKIGEWAVESIPGLAQLANSVTDLADHVFPNFKASILGLGTSMGLVSPEAKSEADEIKNLQQQIESAGYSLDRGVMSNEDYIAALRQVRGEIADLIPGTEDYGKELDALLLKHKDLGVELSTANGILGVARQRYAEGTISAAQFAEAQKNVADIQKKLNELNPEYSSSLAGLTSAYQKQEGAINTLENAIGQLLSVQDRTAAQNAILAEATTKLTGLLKQQADAHGLVAAAAQGQGKAYDNLVKSADDLMTKEIASGVAVSQAKAVLDQLTASTDTSAEHTRAVRDAVQQYGDAIKRAGGAMTDQIAVNVNGVSVLTTVGDALNKAKDAQGIFTTTMVNGVGVVKQTGEAYASTSTQVERFSKSVSSSTVDVSKAVNFYSSLAATVSHVGEATADALSVNNAWNDSMVTSVDNTSRFANSVSGLTGALHNMATAQDEAGTAAFDADKSFKATTGSVNALSVGVAFLAMQLSGLTVFAGSGINYAAGGSDVQHQLYLAQQAAGDPTKQATSFTVGTSGNQKGNIFTSLSDLQQAVEDAAKNTTGLTTAINSLSDATKKASDSTTQYVDGMGNVYDSYQKMAAAVDANPDLGGLFTTVTKGMNDFSNIPIQALSGNVDGLSTSVDGLSQSSTTAAGAIQAASNSISQAVANVAPPPGSTQPTYGSKSGTSDYQDSAGNHYATQAALYDALAKNPLLGVSNINTGGMPQQTSAPTMFSSPAFGSQYFSQNGGASMGSGGVGSAPSNFYAGYQQQPGAPVTQYAPVASNQQTGPQIKIEMNYPQFNSQQQADMVMKQVVTQLRTVVGAKL